MQTARKTTAMSLTSLTAPFEVARPRHWQPASECQRSALRRQGPGPGRRAGSLGPPTAPLSMCSSVDSELNLKLKFEPRWPAMPVVSVTLAAVLGC